MGLQTKLILSNYTETKMSNLASTVITTKLSCGKFVCNEGSISGSKKICGK